MSHEPKSTGTGAANPPASGRTAAGEAPGTEPGELGRAATEGDIASAPTQVPPGARADQPGDVIGGRYELVCELGGGGYGEVWEATRRADGQRVALKMLRASHTRMPEVVRRFEDEVKAAARLTHPSIVRVHDIGRDEASQRPWIAMEYVDGDSLGRYFDVDDLAGLTQVLWLLAELLDALAAAHARGVVHRDLKPENVLVIPGEPLRVKLLDFGVARIDPMPDSTTTEGPRTRVGVAVGTVPFMSPEQVSGDSSTVGPATDLFAVGVMLYRVLAGRLPFTGNPVQTMYGISTRPAPPIDTTRLPGVPFELYFLVYELLQKRPERRPEFAADVRQRIAAVLARMPAPGATPRLQDGGSSVESAVNAAASMLSTDEAVVDARFGDTGALSQRVLSWRDPPLIGRAELEAELLGAVLDANRAQAPRCVVLAGEPGIGKRRLARWLFERVHEQGYMRRVRVQRCGEHGFDRALQAALQRALWAPRLDREVLATRIDETLRLSDAWQQTLCDFLLHPASETADDAQVERWLDVARQAVIQITDFPRPRPMLVWIDGADERVLEPVVRWLRTLLGIGAERGLRVLIVLPLDSDVIEAERGRIDGFAAREDVRLVDVPALDDAALREIATAFVPELGDDAVAVAVEQAEGSPRRLRRVLLDWVGRDALRRRDDGKLALRETPEAFDDAVALQVRAFIGEDDHKDAALRGLCGLAILGAAITRSQAAALLQGTGIDVEALVGGRLLVVQRDDGGDTSVFEFADRDVVRWLQGELLALSHPERLKRRCFGLRVRTALELMSAGDWAAARNQAADAWRLLEDMDRPPGALRVQALDVLARLAALQREVDALRRHAEEMARCAAVNSTKSETRTQFMAASELWFGWAAVLDDDADAARRHLLSAHAFAIIGDDLGLMGRAQLRLGLVAVELEADPDAAAEAFDQARNRLRRALDGVDVADVADTDRYLVAVVLADTLVYRAEVHATKGEFEQAHACVQEALERYVELGDLQGQVRIYLAMARLLRQEVERRGERPSTATDILEHLERARELLSDLADRRGRALLAWETAYIAYAEGRYPVAEHLFSEAGYTFAMIGDRHSAALCRNVCGEAARRDGRYDVALEHYEAARDVFDDIDYDYGRAMVTANIGWTLLARGDAEEAASHFAAAASTMRRGQADDRVGAYLGHAAALCTAQQVERAMTPLTAALELITSETDLDTDGEIHLDADARGALETLQDADAASLSETAAQVAELVANRHY